MRNGVRQEVVEIARLILDVFNLVLHAGRWDEEMEVCMSMSMSMTYPSHLLSSHIVVHYLSLVGELMQRSEGRAEPTVSGGRDRGVGTIVIPHTCIFA